MIFEAALEGFGIVFSWPNVIYPVAGTLLAMVFSFLPGISGVTLMALVIPLTLDWDLHSTVLLFGALVGGGTFMGSVTAILFNIPGSAPNAATMLDGFPLTQRGEARTAIACSAVASAMGSTVGIVILIGLIPVVRGVLLAVGPPELLVMAIWGLTTIALVSRRAVLKGAIAAGLGLTIGLVGMDPRTGDSRYTFGLDLLDDGIPYVPMFLGMFALAEMIDLFVSGRRSVANLDDEAALGGSRLAGCRAVFANPGLLARSSVIGSIVGAIPGIGGTVASFVAYGQAATADPEGSFGKGDLRGVLAPEAANDAKDGASLLPVLAFGIPGSAGTVLLLAVLTIHGVSPGPQLLESHLPLVFVLIWSLFLSNWLTSILGLAASGQFARLSIVSARLMVPVVTVLVALAALGYRGSLTDLIVVTGFGLLGYGMKAHGWPRISLVIAAVLATLFEGNLVLSIQLFELGRLSPLDRPVLLALLGLLILTLAWPVWSRRRRSIA